MKEISEVAWNKINEVVKSYPAKWNAGNVCAHSQVDRMSGLLQNSGAEDGMACHAYIINNPQYILINAHSKQYQGTNPDFTLWVARESPFNHGVINKEDTKNLLEHASVIDLHEVGRGGALWLCKALRHFNEDVWKPAVWSKLREEGLTGLQAFIGCDILNEDGSPSDSYCTHVGLFSYGTPQRLRDFYDEMLRIKRIDDSNAARQGKGAGYTWGSMKGKPVKKPDGWGGFVEVMEPGSAKDYAALLKEIFEGDPKNVK